MRADKWLWCARFFNTRAAAADAIRKGKVKINDAKAKPSRPVKPEDELTIRKGVYTYTISISRLSSSRLSPPQAAILYKENEDSIKRRRQLAMQLETNDKARPRTKGRPSKRERRELVRFMRRGG